MLSPRCPTLWALHGSRGVGQQLAQLVDRQPGAPGMDRPMAVGAQQGQLVEPRPPIRREGVERPDVVALDRAGAALGAVSLRGIESASLAGEPAAALDL